MREERGEGKIREMVFYMCVAGISPEMDDCPKEGGPKVRTGQVGDACYFVYKNWIKPLSEER